MNSHFSVTVRTLARNLSHWCCQQCPFPCFFRHQRRLWEIHSSLHSYQGRTTPSKYHPLHVFYLETRTAHTQRVSTKCARSFRPWDERTWERGEGRLESNFTFKRPVVHYLVISLFCRILMMMTTMIIIIMKSIFLESHNKFTSIYSRPVTCGINPPILQGGRVELARETPCFPTIVLLTSRRAVKQRLGTSQVANLGLVRARFSNADQI